MLQQPSVRIANGLARARALARGHKCARIYATLRFNGPAPYRTIKFRHTYAGMTYKQRETERERERGRERFCLLRAED